MSQPLPASRSWAVAALCAALVAGGCPAGPEPTEEAMVEPEPLPQEPWQAARHATTVLGTVTEELQPAQGPAAARLARAALARTSLWEQRPEVPGAAVVGYFRGRLQLVAGEPEAVAAQGRRLAADASVAPEALFLLLESANRAGQTQRRNTYERLLGRLLPLSTYGLMADRAATPRDSLSEGPVIPDLRREKLIEIASSFAEMGMLPEADGAYREAIYGGFGPPWAAEPRPETWLSPETMDLWLSLGEVQRVQGRMDAAAGAAARALVFGAAKQRDAAAAMLDRLEQGDRSAAASLPAELRLDGERLLHVARLYAGMNLHPRAIALLRQHRAALSATAERLEGDLVEQWRQLLRQHCAGVAGPCVVFGRDVRGMERPEALSIPEPAAPAAVAEVAAAVERVTAQEPER
jgi:hypothetical protein